jgi:hypothetical protein
MEEETTLEQSHHSMMDISNHSQEKVRKSMEMKQEIEEEELMEHTNNKSTTKMNRTSPVSIPSSPNDMYEMDEEDIRSYFLNTIQVKMANSGGQKSLIVELEDIVRPSITLIPFGNSTNSSDDIDRICSMNERVMRIRRILARVVYCIITNVTTFTKDRPNFRFSFPYSGDVDCIPFISDKEKGNISITIDYTTLKTEITEYFAARKRWENLSGRINQEDIRNNKSLLPDCIYFFRFDPTRQTNNKKTTIEVAGGMTITSLINNGVSSSFGGTNSTAERNVFVTITPGSLKYSMLYQDYPYSAGVQSTILSRLWSTKKSGSPNRNDYESHEYQESEGQYDGFDLPPLPMDSDDVPSKLYDGLMMIDGESTVEDVIKRIDQFLETELRDYCKLVMSRFYLLEAVVNRDKSKGMNKISRSFYENANVCKLDREDNVRMIFLLYICSTFDDDMYLKKMPIYEWYVRAERMYCKEKLSLLIKNEEQVVEMVKLRVPDVAHFLFDELSVKTEEMSEEEYKEQLWIQKEMSAKFLSRHTTGTIPVNWFKVPVFDCMAFSDPLMYFTHGGFSYVTHLDMTEQFFPCVLEKNMRLCMKQLDIHLGPSKNYERREKPHFAIFSNVSGFITGEWIRIEPNLNESNPLVKEKVKLPDIEDLGNQRFMPLCMHRVFKHFKKAKELKNKGRFLVASYLKDINKSESEIASFMEKTFCEGGQRSYPQINEYRHYAKNYNNQERYGMGCNKLINNPLNEGDYMICCPFKQQESDPNKLRELIEDYGGMSEPYTGYVVLAATQRRNPYTACTLHASYLSKLSSIKASRFELKLDKTGKIVQNTAMAEEVINMELPTQTMRYPEMFTYNRVIQDKYLREHLEKKSESNQQQKQVQEMVVEEKQDQP